MPPCIEASAATCRAVYHSYPCRGDHEINSSYHTYPCRSDHQINHNCFSEPLSPRCLELLLSPVAPRAWMIMPAPRTEFLGRKVMVTGFTKKGSPVTVVERPVVAVNKEVLTSARGQLRYT